MDPAKVKGFLSPVEGQMLSQYAVQGVLLGEAVEIGSWCGRSTIYIANEIAKTGRLFFAIDHHRGSEENQPNWEWFDKEVWDEQAKAIDTLPHFRNNIRLAKLEATVVAMVGNSAAIGKAWGSPVGFLFLDGGHTMSAALADYRAWVGHITQGGILAIHDVFPDPADGGRPPFEVCEMAIASGLFARIDQVDSLMVLQRL